MLIRPMLAVVALMTIPPLMACDFKVDAAWIREAPPTATTLAGYAKFVNTGSRPLRIQSIQSEAFAAVEAHETKMENGISTMRALSTLEIPAKGSLEFTPNGKHLMLMNPTRTFKKGDSAKLTFKDASGCIVAADFVVGSAPAGSQQESAAHHHEH